MVKARPGSLSHAATLHLPGLIRGMTLGESLDLPSPFLREKRAGTMGSALCFCILPRGLL